MKWTNLNVGPRKIKPVEKLISSVNWALKSFTELSGVIGQPETENKFTYMAPFTPVSNPEGYAILNAVGEKYNWQISLATLANLENDLKSALQQIKSTIPVVDKRISPEESIANEANRNQFRKEQEEKQTQATIATNAILAKKPAWATALIVAELDQDDSDLMTDYHSHKTLRHVAIGWRSGSKEDFRQLRKAAGNFSETVHLGPDADDKIEHRENYSMGAGNYLKNGHRDNSGWSVKSYPVSILNGLARYDYEDQLPDAVTTPTEAIASGSEGLTIKKNTEKNGIELHFSNKPEEAVLNQLKSAGFRWSRFNKCWYTKDTPENLAFAESLV